jgi:hypothetical protein
MMQDLLMYHTTDAVSRHNRVLHAADAAGMTAGVQ